MAPPHTIREYRTCIIVDLIAFITMYDPTHRDADTATGVMEQGPER